MDEKSSEIYYNQIFIKAPLAIALISSDGTIKDINMEFTKLFKFERDEAVGKNIDELITTEEYRDEAKEITKQVNIDRVEKETTRFDKYKNPIEVIIVGIKFKDVLNNDLIFATYQDITQRKIQDRKIQYQKDIIKLINKILRHDLMNYFSVIRSAFRIYKETKEEEYLLEAEMQTEKGIKLIRAMKNFEKLLQSGNNMLRYINARKSIENIIKLYPNFDIFVKGEIFIRVDETFSQIIENLINNAIKHGKASKIEIELTEDNNEKIILVKDNGAGIPQKIKNVIFDEGFSYGKSGNTGLGLYIVKKLMEIYNGKVEVKDNDFGGTIFILKFPK